MMADAWIEIPLGGRKHTGFTAIIDVDDYWLVNQYRWRVRLDKSLNPAYVQTGPACGPRILLHQLVTGLKGQCPCFRDIRPGQAQVLRYSA